MANAQLFAKLGLIVLIVVSMGVLIERLTDARRFWNQDPSDVRINSTVSPNPTADIQEQSFSENFSECLRKHSDSSYYYPINETSAICNPQCLHDFLIHLSEVFETLNIKLLLLEPSLLFCLLPSSRKYNLITRGFELNKVQQSRNVLTFGIYSSDVKILDEASSIRKIILSAHCTYRKFKRFKENESENADEKVHYFFRRRDVLVHVIVLNVRGTYLLSHALYLRDMNDNGLQYVKDSAFENFSVSSVFLDTSSAAHIFLPFDARYFLLDFMSSHFIECKPFSVNMISNQRTEVAMALKELKQVLASQMVIFWLWSKTLQGFFEKCDILYYTEELKFSVAAKSVSGFNFTGLFANSECQHVESNYNMDSSTKNVKLNCHGIYIDLIFMYENKVTYWYEYIDEKIIYRLTFRKFTLCSTDIFEQKIALPCEIHEIFDSEYGQFLKNTTLIFDSDTMKNVLYIGKT